MRREKEALELLDGVSVFEQQVIAFEDHLTEAALPLRIGSGFDSQGSVLALVAGDAPVGTASVSSASRIVMPSCGRR